MTKNPTCPTCGSINTTEMSSFGKENKLLCHACNCEWWESRRKKHNTGARIAPSEAKVLITD